MLRPRIVIALLLVVLAPVALEGEPLQLRDVFELEWASDPRISPAGDRVAFVRNSMDIQVDQRSSEIWIADIDGGVPRPLVTGPGSPRSPRWSPDGSRLAYVSSSGGSSQIHVLWLGDGRDARVSHLEAPPRALEWSPDGASLAFAMKVPDESEALASMPAAPEGAEWAPPVKVIERMIYRFDGAGFVDPGHVHLFILPAIGGTPRQLTSGNFNHFGPLSWSPDSNRIVFSANRRDDWEYEPNDSEVWEIDVSSGELRPLTDRRGPDDSPALSPDGEWVAYRGFDDRYQGYQLDRLYVQRRDGSERRELASDLGRSVGQIAWHDDGRGVYLLYTDRGTTRLALAGLDGSVEEVAQPVGGLSLGRPYSGGQFDAHGDRVVFTTTTPDRPADLVTATRGSSTSSRVLTRLNEDLLAHRDLAPVEEIWTESSHDGRKIQAWVAFPPGFDPKGSYPLILEIHGGPFADYGPRFAAEIQLFAAAGYVVVYANPRGSSSYGEEFGNLIHHNYPGEDYDDLMSVVDAVVERGFIDEDRLFVTGGSGGGVLTAWIVGKTDRFRAAVVAKPVIHWTSFVLTADAYNFFYKYWFPGPPWEHQEQYWKRSPLSLVGNVTTPTMVLTGEEDYRTPMSESEQYYQALVLEKVPAALVRVPGASHGIAARPSQLIAKVANILAWFERHDAREEGPGGGE